MGNHNTFTHLQDMAPKTLNQEEIFYYEPWSIFTETICLVEMDTKVKNGRWEAGDVGQLRPKTISDFLHKLTSDPYYLQITFDQFIDKSWEWQSRYRRFQQLIDDT